MHTDACVLSQWTPCLVLPNGWEDASHWHKTIRPGKRWGIHHLLKTAPTFALSTWILRCLINTLIYKMILIYKGGQGGHYTCMQNMIAKAVKTQVSSRGKKQTPALCSVPMRPLAPVNKVSLHPLFLYCTIIPRNRHANLLTNLSLLTSELCLCYLHVLAVSHQHLKGWFSLLWWLIS